MRHFHSFSTFKSDEENVCFREKGKKSPIIIIIVLYTKTCIHRKAQQNSDQNCGW